MGSIICRSVESMTLLVAGRYIRMKAANMGNDLDYVTKLDLMELPILFPNFPRETGMM
jgi:hypothetical protein